MIKTSILKNAVEAVNGNADGHILKLFNVKRLVAMIKRLRNRQAAEVQREESCQVRRNVGKTI